MTTARKFIPPSVRDPRVLWPALAAMVIVALLIGLRGESTRSTGAETARDLDKLTRITLRLERQVLRSDRRAKGGRKQTRAQVKGVRRDLRRLIRSLQELGIAVPENTSGGPSDGTTSIPTVQAGTTQPVGGSAGGGGGSGGGPGGGNDGGGGGNPPSPPPGGGPPPKPPAPSQSVLGLGQDVPGVSECRLAPILCE